jgi:SecY interacting protein Syd
MNDSVEEALDALVDAFLEGTHERHGRDPCQERDLEWPSPCEHEGSDTDGKVTWRPVRRETPADFSGLAAALETAIHPDFKAYFGRYWSDPIPSSGLCGNVELLQLWNPADEERMVANQLGHVLQARRAKRPLTLFFACGDDPDQLYSLDNTTGEVLREDLPKRGCALNPAVDRYHWRSWSGCAIVF